jgi:hypothetical protein
MRCVVTDQHGKIVVDAPIDETSGLYFIDISYFMQRGDVNATINARRRPITKKIKAAVKELHECLHQAASPAVMARALRFGAWPNMEMLPTDVERVFPHQDCLACMLGKLNRLPHAFSAETSESSFLWTKSLSIPFLLRGTRDFISSLSGAPDSCSLSSQDLMIVFMNCAQYECIELT